MSSFVEYEQYDGLGLAELVTQGQVSAGELLDAAIERAERYNPATNALILKMYDEARKTVQQKPASGPFHGVPFLLKDTGANYAGFPSLGGCAFSKHLPVPAHDSELTRRYKQAGLVTFGKTNMPEFGMQVTTEPQGFDVCHNPWDLTRTSGGSSGGSAVAVATGMVPIAHASDGAGSIRIPASCCGLLGLKVSRGLTPFGPDAGRVWQGLVVQHAITRSVRDSAAILDVEAGSDAGASFYFPKPQESFLANLDKPLGKLKIALMEKPFFATEVHADCLTAVHDTAKLCEGLGHHIEAKDLIIDEHEVLRAFSIIMSAEAATNLAGLTKRIGRQAQDDEVEAATLLFAKLGKHFNAANLTWAIARIDALARETATFFAEYDVLLSPTLAQPPVEIGALMPTPAEEQRLKALRYLPVTKLTIKEMQHYVQRIYDFIPFTSYYNMTGYPAITVPLYWNKAGLPIGSQFGAGFAKDGLLLQLAAQLEQARPWKDKRPPLVSAS